MSEMREALEEMRQALMRGTCEPALGKGYAALAAALERLEQAEVERGLILAMYVATPGKPITIEQDKLLKQLVKAARAAKEEGGRR